MSHLFGKRRLVFAFMMNGPLICVRQEIFRESSNRRPRLTCLFKITVIQKLSRLVWCGPSSDMLRRPIRVYAVPLPFKVWVENSIDVNGVNRP